MNVQEDITLPLASALALAAVLAVGVLAKCSSFTFKFFVLWARCCLCDGQGAVRGAVL